MTTIRHWSILEFGRGAFRQAVALGITRPLHATVWTALNFKIFKHLFWNLEKYDQILQIKRRLVVKGDGANLTAAYFAFDAMNGVFFECSTNML